MATHRKYGYIEGNTVRKIQPVERPERRSYRENERHVQHRPAVKEQAQYTTVIYMTFLAVLSCLVLWSCVHYLQLQAETTSRVKNIAALEMQLEELRKENDDNYTRIMTSVDLDYIKDVAINELGMVYAQPDQVILYDGGTKDYVRQSQEIPKEENSSFGKIWGN